MLSDRAFIFPMCIPCTYTMTFLVIPRSRSNIKVTFKKKKKCQYMGMHVCFTNTACFSIWYRVKNTEYVLGRDPSIPV